MKYTILIAIATLASVTFGEIDKAKKPKVSEGFANRREEVMTKKYGGFVKKPGTGEGHILFVNANSKVAAKSLEKVAEKISEELRVQYKIHNVDQASLNQGASILKNQKATAGVFLIADESMPMLVTVPDQQFAFINTSLISNLSENKLQACIARALCLVCGAGNRASTGHLLSQVTEEKDFDKIQLKHIPGDVLLTVQGFLRDSGIKTFQVRTYRQACAEGWAPQPSNEWQKAIWDKIHATPKNPMKIEFDPKKGR